MGWIKSYLILSIVITRKWIIIQFYIAIITTLWLITPGHDHIVPSAPLLFLLPRLLLIIFKRICIGSALIYIRTGGVVFLRLVYLGLMWTQLGILISRGALIWLWLEAAGAQGWSRVLWITASLISVIWILAHVITPNRFYNLILFAVVYSIMRFGAWGELITRIGTRFLVSIDFPNEVVFTLSLGRSSGTLFTFFVLVFLFVDGFFGGFKHIV